MLDKLRLLTYVDIEGLGAELSHRLVGMWSCIQTVSLNEECDGQIVKDVLFELVGGILSQNLEKTGFLR